MGREGYFFAKASRKLGLGIGLFKYFSKLADS